MPRNTTPKRKKVVLSLKQKLEIVDKLAKGRSGAAIALEYGIGKATVSDIKKQGPQLRLFAEKHLPAPGLHASSTSGPKTMKLGTHRNLDEAVFKWYQQHTSTGIAIRSVELQAAADRLAQDLGISNFKCSAGWLYRFR